MRWEAIVGYNMLPGALRGFKNAIFFFFTIKESPVSLKYLNVK
jgi:hypothetical protein